MIDLASGFAWFEQPADSRDPAQQERITDGLSELWSDVRREIGEQRFDSILGETRVGRFTMGSDGAWVQTNGEKEHGFVNLTLELDAGELSLNVIGWYDEQLERMEAWLRKPAAWRLLRGMPDWQLIIFVRQANVGASGKAVFRGAPGIEQERIAFSETSPANITTRLIGLKPSLDPVSEKLALHIRHGWGPAEAEAIDDLPATIAREVEPWLEPLQVMRTG